MRFLFPLPTSHMNGKGIAFDVFHMEGPTAKVTSLNGAIASPFVRFTWIFNLTFP